MGIPLGGSSDIGRARVENTFAAAGNGDPFQCRGVFNLWILEAQTGATVTLQASADGGSNWISCAADGVGTVAAWTAIARKLTIEEVEAGVLVRCVVSGTFTGNVRTRLSY